MIAPTLKTFSTAFPLDKPCGLWKMICESKNHTEPAEKQAVARAMVKDILTNSAVDYFSAYSKQVQTLYPVNGFTAYDIGLFSGMPKFSNRKSKKRSKTVLGWAYGFLMEAGETELLAAFEEEITDHLPT